MGSSCSCIPPLPSEQFDYPDRFRKLVVVHCDFIVRKAPSRRVVAEAIAAGFDKLVPYLSMHLHAIEQSVRMGIAECRAMPEGNATTRRHFPSRCRSIMLEHGTQTVEKMREIGLPEAGSFRKLGVDEDMGAVEAIGHNVLATHGAILDPF